MGEDIMGDLENRVQEVLSDPLCCMLLLSWGVTVFGSVIWQLFWRFETRAMSFLVKQMSC